MLQIVFIGQGATQIELFTKALDFDGVTQKALMCIDQSNLSHLVWEMNVNWLQLFDYCFLTY